MSQNPDEDGAYRTITQQLLSQEMNIEYVAANLEIGAQRAIAKGFQPTAFNLASWHQRGLQTDAEISKGRWNPGGAIYVLDDIPTALKVMGLTSTWSARREAQYLKYK